MTLLYFMQTSQEAKGPVTSWEGDGGNRNAGDR